MVVETMHGYLKWYNSVSKNNTNVLAGNNKDNSRDNYKIWYSTKLRIIPKHKYQNLGKQTCHDSHPNPVFIF